MKSLFKDLIHLIASCFALPWALLSGFGRVRAMYLMGAHAVAQLPGIPGDYIRCGYYALTLKSCSKRCRISYGVIFSNPDAVVEDGVYIGPYSIFGRVRLGKNSQIASLVQILSGAKQHGRNEKGEILTGHEGIFSAVSVGANCWIGASAIVMADVGEGSTVGAGSVVTKPVEPRVTVVGNPARVLGTRPV